MQVKAVRVNIDKEKSLGEKYGIKMLPSLMIFSKKNKTGTPYELPDAEYFLDMVCDLKPPPSSIDACPDLPVYRIFTSCVLDRQTKSLRS